MVSTKVSVGGLNTAILIIKKISRRISFKSDAYRNIFKINFIIFYLFQLKYSDWKKLDILNSNKF